MSPASKTDALETDLPSRWGPLQRIKNTAIYYGVCTAAAALRCLPRGFLRRFGTFLGVVGFRIARSDRTRAQQQLQSAFPAWSETEVEQRVREMFVQLGHAACDALIVDRVLAQDPSAQLSEAQRRMFDEALAEGRGVVAVGGHIGNWELCAQAIAFSGVPLSVIASPLYDPRLTRLVDRFRRRSGARVLWRGDQRVSKEMLRVFKRNEVLGLLIDQDTKVQGEFVPFFGRPAHTPVAAAHLALRFRAPIIVGFARHKDQGYELGFERFPYQEGATPKELTAALTTRIEQIIRESPEQWVWFHKRWRTQPATAAGTN